MKFGIALHLIRVWVQALPAVFNIRKSYTYDTAIILRFYKKRKKNPEYYPGIFSYYICSSFSSICKPPFKTMIIVLSFITLMYSTKRLIRIRS